MGIFLDTGFYIGLIDPTDSHYKRSIELLIDLKSGKYGQIFTSNFIMAESATIVASTTKNNSIAINEIKKIFTGDERIAIILRANEELEKESWELFQKLNKKENKVISYVDCTNILFCQKYLLNFILSFDAHYDGWVNRIF